MCHNLIWGFSDAQRAPDSANGPTMIGPGDLSKAVSVHSTLAMVTAIAQTLTIMAVAGEEGNIFLIKAACTISTTLGYELKKVRYTGVL